MNLICLFWVPIYKKIYSVIQLHFTWGKKNHFIAYNICHVDKKKHSRDTELSSQKLIGYDVTHTKKIVFTAMNLGFFIRQKLRVKIKMKVK